MAQYVTGVLVYSVLFMDWNTDQQPFEAVSLVPSPIAQYPSHRFAGTEQILVGSRVVLALETIRTKKHVISHPDRRSMYSRDYCIMWRWALGKYPYDFMCIISSETKSRSRFLHDSLNGSVLVPLVMP